MGWVEDKFLDKIAIGKLTQPLWDGLRDSVGLAVIEFQEMVPSATLRSKDCTSRSSYCIRVERNNGTSLEIYLDTSAQLVHIGSGADEVLICSYRLNVDRSNLEFYKEISLCGKSSFETLTAEAVSKMALEKYLFDPFPTAMVARTLKL